MDLGGLRNGGGAMACPKRERTQVGRDFGAAWVGMMGWEKGGCPGPFLL